MTRTKQMSPDDFIAQVIRIGRLNLFKLMMHEDTKDNLDERVQVEVHLTMQDKRYHYWGKGRSIGLALRDIREQIRVEVGA